MKTILAAVILIATCLTSPAASIYTVGGPTYNPANGHAYYLISEGGWSDAQAYAQSLGGHLATMNDASENAWVYANVNLGNASRNAWLGWNDADGNGTWTWISGEAVTFINWAPGEPNTPTHYYGHFFGPVNPGQWNNTHIGEILYGIVEVVPEPSSLAFVMLSGIVCIAARFRQRKAGQ
jgi:hypothetical protein